MTTGRADVICAGALKVLGGVGVTDSVWFEPWAPLQVVTPAPGMWGRVVYLDSSEDTACVVQNASLGYGTIEVECRDASPRIEGNLFYGAAGGSPLCQRG
jgi:hypothetical protein